MAGLSQSDVQSRVAALAGWAGARLQSVVLQKDILQMEFYLGGAIRYLIFDMSPGRPDLVALERALFKSGEVKPVVLFFKSHFLGKKLLQAEAPADFGRVLRLEFTGGYIAEFRLYPHGQNLSVIAGDKSVSLRKPRELRPVEDGETATCDVTIEAVDLFDLGRQWLDRFNSKTSGKPKDDSQARLKKLRSARAKVEEELANKRESRWLKAGQWISENQSLDVPPEYAGCVDSSESLSWNIERCFNQHKTNLKKIEGTEKRLMEIDRQIETLMSGKALPTKKTAPAVSETAKYRRREIADGIAVVVGKSAAENLKILREAKPWYLWLHLRDRPGAHAIIAMNKGIRLSDDLLRKGTNFLLEVQLGSKANSHIGEDYDVIVTECRFVRPIKGDRLGRVNYSDARTLRHRFHLD